MTKTVCLFSRKTIPIRRLEPYFAKLALLTETKRSLIVFLDSKTDTKLSDMASITKTTFSSL